MVALGDPWHDSSYSILDENGLRHVEVERFTRTKYDGLNPLIAAWMFDREAVESAQVFLFEEGRFFAPLLRRMAAGMAVDLETEVRHLIEDQHGSFGPEQLLKTSGLLEGVVSVFDRIRTHAAKWQILDHHFLHATNAFLSSDFDESIVFSLDGGGSHFLGGRQVEVYGSVYRFDRSGPASRTPLELITGWSPGWAWTRVCRILGYSQHEAGTVMAMAAFGESRRKLNRVVESRALWDILEHDLPPWRRVSLRYLCKRLERLAVDEPSRFAIAKALQDETERRIYRFMAPFLDGAKDVNICLSGGVFLNCVAAGKIRRWFPNVRRVFVPPAPYDAGLSIGLVQNYLADLGIDPCPGGAIAPFSSGRSYDLPTVTEACRAAKLQPPVTESCGQIAERLGRGEIIGLFQGGSESGRRALGNRSILADPRDPAKRDVLNGIIKKRQWFRPFAPMILEEEVDEWFDVPGPFESPYMSFAVPFRAGKGEMVPAVRHKDGTARVQTIHADLTPLTHQLLKAWNEHSGVPILLNTSFNDSEPIVETPEEAIATMVRAEIDGIYFADFGAFVGNPQKTSGA